MVLTRFFIVACVAVCATGCGWQGSRVVSRRLDSFFFGLTGTTLFSTLPTVTVKEIHLDKGLLLGQNIQITGQVVDVGEFGTYAVLADDTARMLIVLTDMDASSLRAPALQTDGKYHYWVMGSVDYGKRGLPFLLVRGIYRKSML
ncbi:MAG: hypothetical protein OXT67_04990 [Zetaproteobacteria bacterium]|nr:hypothetical protein [Zetaproteobacteria bacterium]